MIDKYGNQLPPVILATGAKQYQPLRPPLRPTPQIHQNLQIKATLPTSFVAKSKPEAGAHLSLPLLRDASTVGTVTLPRTQKPVNMKAAHAFLVGQSNTLRVRAEQRNNAPKPKQEGWVWPHQVPYMSMVLQSSARISSWRYWLLKGKDDYWGLCKLRRGTDSPGQLGRKPRRKDITNRQASPRIFQSFLDPQLHW